MARCEHEAGTFAQLAAFVPASTSSTRIAPVTSLPSVRSLLEGQGTDKNGGMAGHMDYANNAYLTVVLSPTSTYQANPGTITSLFPGLDHIGPVRFFFAHPRGYTTRTIADPGHAGRQALCRMST